MYQLIHIHHHHVMSIYHSFIQSALLCWVSAHNGYSSAWFSALLQLSHQQLQATADLLSLTPCFETSHRTFAKNREVILINLKKKFHFLMKIFILRSNRYQSIHFQFLLVFSVGIQGIYNGGRTTVVTTSQSSRFPNFLGDYFH